MKTSGFSKILRGGYITNKKGRIVSYAPCLRCIALSVLSAGLNLVVAQHKAPAADLFWDANGTAFGSGGTGSWDLTNARWSVNNDGVSGPYALWNNAAGDTAIFGSSAGTVTLAATISAAKLRFVDVSNYILQSGNLTLSGAATIDVGMLSATAPIVAVINSALSGTAGLNKTGGGTLTLGGSNNFTGDILINQGSLSVTASAALGHASNQIKIFDQARLISSVNLTGRVVNLMGGTANIQGTGVGSAHFTGSGNLYVQAGVKLTDDTNDFTGQAIVSANNTNTTFS